MAKLMKLNKFSILLIVFVLIFPILISQINILDNTLKENNSKNFYPTLSNNNVELEWERSWGGIGQDIAYDIEIDSSNNIYVAGHYNMSGLPSAFLLKYNSSGGLEWSRTWHEIGGTECYGIAFDSLNNIYLACPKVDPFWCPDHIVLLKYTSAGDLDWYREITIGDICVATGIAIDSSNNIQLSGWTAEISGDPDVLLVKCDSSGFPLWNRTWDNVGEINDADTAIDIVLDSSNNIYLSINTGLVSNPNIGILKYNSSGDLQWTCIRDGGGFDLCKGISLDSAENIYLAGTTEIAGNSQFCLVKVDPNGQYQWNETWGDIGVDMAWEIDIDSSDNIYLGGTSNIEVPLFCYHVGDITLAKYNSLGQYQWDHTRDETQREACFAIKLDSTEENIYLAGLTENIGHNDTLLVKYKLNGASTNRDGKKDIPSYDIFLILIFTSFTLVYFIKKIRKEK